MQTLFMIGPGQVVGYLDLDLEPLYDHDYLELLAVIDQKVKD